MKVLIVDDDPSMRRLLRHVLAGHFGADVVEADDGVAALDYLLGNTADLVVLDLNMRVIGGLETLEAIRRSTQHARLPAVLVSGHIEESGIRRALRLGVEQVIAKPFTLAGLRDRFTRLLANLEVDTPVVERRQQLEIQQDDVVLVADVNAEFRTMARAELGKLCRVEEAANEFAALTRCLSGDFGMLLVGATSELSSVEVFGRKLRGVKHLRDLRLVAAVATTEEARALEGLYDAVVTRSFVPETFQRSLGRVFSQDTLGRYLFHPKSDLLRRYCRHVHDALRDLFPYAVEMHETPPAMPGEALHVSAAVELQSGTAAWDVRLSCTMGPALQIAGMLTAAKDDQVDRDALATALGSVVVRFGHSLQEQASAEGLELKLLAVRTASSADQSLIDARPRLARRWFTGDDREIATLEIVRLQTATANIPSHGVDALTTG